MICTMHPRTPSRPLRNYPSVRYRTFPDFAAAERAAAALNTFASPFNYSAEVDANGAPRIAVRRKESGEFITYARAGSATRQAE